MATDPGFARPLRWPIRWRLPLLICTLLVVSLTAFGWLADREVERALLESAHARLQTVSQQLVGLLAQSSRQRTDEARRLAARPAMQALAAAPDDATARAEVTDELETFLKTSPQTLGIEVWGASGARLLALEQTRPSSVSTASGLAGAEPQKPVIPPPRSTPPAGPGFTPLQGLQGVAFYELAVPLTSASPSGYLLFRRQAMTPGTGGAVGALIGNSITVEFGAPNGGVWTNLSSIVPAPPATRGSGVVAYTTPEGEARLGVGVGIRDTPWTLWVATPRAVALAPAGVFVRAALPIGLAVVLLGAGVAWVAARRMTRPLDELKSAAESIAAGDLARRMRIERHDEIGRLGEVFNFMATRVEEAHRLLEDRVQERTANLEQALSTLRDTQEELVRREKLAMLGQLASGVGHELRNPLGVMTNAVYFLEMVQPDAPAVVKEYFGVLRSQIGLSEKIVSDLLDFARIKPPRREAVTLTRLVDDQIARMPVVDGVRIVREIPADLPPLNVDPIQIGQVVLNLLVNAVQAMEATGGVLTVRGAAEADRIRLDVIDTGPGIAPELQDKIFEALFTTKPRGIGLGLAVSRSLTEANDGRLSVASRAGEGATFTLVVPAIKVLEPVA